jgi:hypothetical protein
LGEVTTHITDELQAVVGIEYGGRTSYPITETDIRRWAMAVYYPERPPPLFWDAEYASKTRHGGIVAPEEFNPFAWMQLAPPVELPQVGDDLPAQPGIVLGPERVFGVRSPELKFQLNGGAEVEYGVRMRPGDVIRSVQSIAGFHEREGRLGLMLFTTSQSQWFNQHDELVKTQRGVLIRY